MQKINKPTLCQQQLTRQLRGETPSEPMRYEFEGRGAPEAKIVKRSTDISTDPVLAYIADESRRISEL